MLLAIQLLSVVAILGFTFIFFQVVGERTPGLLYTRKSADAWTSILRSKFGTYVVMCSILGTLTSLATVYIFFLGTSKLFGWVTFICVLAMIFGGLVANYLSRLIRVLPRVREVLSADYQSGAVITSLFWGETINERQVSKIVRTVSLFSIAGIVWLEFAVFADVSGALLGFDFCGRIAVITFTSFVVMLFTFRYGLRGFVYADLFHVAVIMLAAVALLGGIFYLFLEMVPNESLTRTISVLVAPILDWKSCILFSLHVIVLNSFLVIVSESHWLRMWLFNDSSTNDNKEISKQVSAQLWNGGVWLIFIVAGLAASSISGAIDLESISIVLERLAWISTRPNSPNT